MSTIKARDRFKDCKNCRIWKTDHTKATCILYQEEGFHPDRNVPAKCIGKVTRIY